MVLPSFLQVLTMEIFFFGDNAHNDSGSIRYNHTNDRMEFFTNRTSQVIIDSSGHLGISTTNPTQYINTGNFFKPSSSGTAKFLTIDGGTSAANIMLQGNITGENPLGAFTGHRQTVKAMLTGR